MRSLEVIQAFPVFVFAMVLVAVFGGTKVNIIAAIAFVNTPVFVRLVRSDVLSLVQRPFAEAARAVWQLGMADRVPAYSAQCDPDDLCAAVRNDRVRHPA